MGGTLGSLSKELWLLAASLRAVELLPQPQTFSAFLRVRVIHAHLMHRLRYNLNDMAGDAPFRSFLTSEQ